MFGGRFDWLRVQFFITAAFALPGRKDCIRIARALIDGADRRNDLAAAARTCPPARGAPVDVDLKLYCQVFQSQLIPWFSKTWSERYSLCGQDVRAPSYPDLRWRKAITNIVQKIDTGGTSSTSTPILKFLMKVLFAPRDARHMTH